MNFVFCSLKCIGPHHASLQTCSSSFDMGIDTEIIQLKYVCDIIVALLQFSKLQIYFVQRNRIEFLVETRRLCKDNVLIQRSLHLHFFSKCASIHNTFSPDCAHSLPLSSNEIFTGTLVRECYAHTFSLSHV